MAEEVVPEISQAAPEETGNITTEEDMVVETTGTVSNADIPDPGHTNGDGESNFKRSRESGDELEEENGGVSKKQKAEKSVEEERLEELGDEGETVGEEGRESDPVSIGPKKFASSIEMFDYFYKFLHFWPPNLDVNEYEHMVFLDLLKKGHPEPEKKIGVGIHAFQVRYHPTFKSRCFFLLRDDESVDDFSFRKCVDHILPLPENMKQKADVNKALGGGGGRGGRGGGGGRRGGRFRGRGGRSRN